MKLSVVSSKLLVKKEEQKKDEAAFFLFGRADGRIRGATLERAALAIA